MHPQTKRLKFNILLTTYEILLKDKVIALLEGDRSHFYSVEHSLDLHAFGLWVIKFSESVIALAFASMAVCGSSLWGVGVFLKDCLIFFVCVVRFSVFFHFIK